MMWFFAALIVLALGGVAAVASGRGAALAPTYDDRPDALAPPAGAVTGDDLRRVRFTLAVRGYRMSEVDELLERLATQLDGAAPDGRDAGRQQDTPDLGFGPNQRDPDRI